MTESDTLRNRARSLRRQATEAEKEFSRQLCARLPLDGTYFRRQVPLGPYFVDFVCLKHRLVIELDGGQHSTEEGRTADTVRTRHLQQDGFRVLRSWNHQVLIEIDAVLDTILTALHDVNRPLTSLPKEAS